MSRRKIYCLGCGEYKEFHAKELCYNCYAKKWRIENPEKEKKRKKKWRKEHPEYEKKYRVKNAEHINELQRKNWAKHTEKSREYGRKYRAKNQEKVNEKNRKYRENNKEKIKISTKKYQQSFKGKLNIRQKNIKRRTSGIVGQGVISRIINENIFKYGIITCEACKKRCLNNYHIDHIISIYRSGGNSYENLQVLCANCNVKKHIKIINYKQDTEDNQMFLRESF